MSVEFNFIHAWYSSPSPGSYKTRGFLPFFDTGSLFLSRTTKGWSCWICPGMGSTRRAASTWGTRCWWTLTSRNWTWTVTGSTRTVWRNSSKDSSRTPAWEHSRWVTGGVASVRVVASVCEGVVIVLGVFPWYMRRLTCMMVKDSVQCVRAVLSARDQRKWKEVSLGRNCNHLEVSDHQ